MKNLNNPGLIHPDKFYTVAEAADLLGVHRSTLWRWVKASRLASNVRKINNRNEFLGSELLKLFNHKSDGFND